MFHRLADPISQAPAFGNQVIVHKQNKSSWTNPSYIIAKLSAGQSHSYSWGSAGNLIVEVCSIDTNSSPGVARVLVYADGVNALTCDGQTATPVATPTSPVATPNASNPVSGPTTSMPVATPTNSKPVAVPTTSTPVAVPTTSKPVATPTTSKPVSVPTTSKPVATPTTSKPVAVPTSSKPVATPTTATTSKPVATPTVEGPCQDNDRKWQSNWNIKMRNCSWASGGKNKSAIKRERQRVKRCARGNTALECPVTCKTGCTCSDSTGVFFKKRTCEKISNNAKGCNYMRNRANCPKACGVC